MIGRFRFLRSFFVFAVFILVISPVSVFAGKDDDTTIHYVALGDSLAKGMDSYGDPNTDKGYPYYIKQSLEENRYEVDYKNFGVNGYTTSDVLEDLQTRDEIVEKLAEANVITISAGANDLLGAIGEISEIDFSDEEELIALGKRVEEAIQSVGDNTAGIMSLIHNINPEAHIYVMGYYNAMPYLDQPLQEQLVPMLDGLNDAIEKVSNVFEATFIPTFEIFEGNYEEFLPNPHNIHPNEAGYRALANGFMAEMIKVYPFLNKDISVNLGEETTVVAGDQLLIVNTAILLPNDLPKGTTVTVTEVDEKLYSKSTNMLKIGDVIQFNFKFPDDLEHYEGNFQLVMNIPIDRLTEEEIDIYYYNEIEGEWEAQQAEIDIENAVATMDVTHFSNYGLFATVASDEVVEDEHDEKEVPSTDDGEDDEEEDVSSGTPVQEDEGNRLPDTALHHYTWMIFGGFFLFAGLAVIYMRKKQFIS